MTDSRTSGTPDASASWRRARRSMKRLFDALADLDERGGVASLADAELWTEAEVRRAVDDMTLLRQMLWAEVTRLRMSPDEPAPK